MFSFTEVWVIKSNTIADEFDTLDVQKLEKPTTRSNIAKMSKEEPMSRSIVQDLSLASKSAMHSTAALNYKKGSTVDNLLDQTPKVKNSEQHILSKGMNGDGFIVTDVANNKKEQKVDTKRTKVRQEIEPNPEVYPGENIGKPYGDPDGYQTIGDGIFLMSTEQEAALSPKSTGSNTRNLDTFLTNSNSVSELIAGKERENAFSKSLPEPTKENLPDILTDLDKNSAKRRKNSTQHIEENFHDKRNVTLINEESGEKNEATEKANSRNSESMDSKIDGGEQHEKGKNSSGSEKANSSEEVDTSGPAADLDAMTPTEMNALQSFQNKLGQEDKVIGKLMLAKKVDKGQQDFIEKTNAMLHKENQKQIDNVMERYKNEESNFIKKNPYVLNKPKLLEKIKNTTYQDVTATKRGFLATNDNLRVENVYNSLLKEDEVISKGLNEKAEARKAILRHKDNPEDEQVSKFLDFLEEEDKHTENGDADVKPMKKTKGKKAKLQSKNLRLLVLEPSLGALSDKFTADGTPQLTDKDLAHMLGDVSAKSNKVKKLKATLKKLAGDKRKVRKEPVMKVLQNDLRNITKERERKLKTKSKGKKAKSEARNGVKWGISNAKETFSDDYENHYTQIKVMEINGGKRNRNRNSEKPTLFNKTENSVNKNNINAQKSDRKQKLDKQKGKRQQYIHKKISNTNSRRRVTSHKILRKSARHHKVQKQSNMKKGDMTNDLYVSVKTKNDKPNNNDKEYYWHGTVKPETRQLPTNPTDQIRKFGRISNILPVSFQPAAPEGIGQVIGDSSNIASLGTATKETTGFEDTDSETDTSKTYESNADHFHKLGLNKIDENAISSTSFFSASKPRQDEYNQALKQGIDPMAQKYVNSAMKEINDKDFEKVAGLVDKDSSKVVSMFDPNTLRPKLEEFIGNEHEGEKENLNEQYDERTNEHQNGNMNKKHKLKIVLHLPEKIDGNIQEIHGKDSEMPIGTIKDLTMQYTKAEKNPSLGQELADDDEDTLEGILSKPTAKLEEFHPQATVPSVEYVPETVVGKESNEWNKKGSEEEDASRDEEAKERNDSDYIDNVKSNKLLSMIKHSEELLQKELGRHEKSEEKTEGFVSKADDDEDEYNNSMNHHEQGESKSVTRKKKPHLKSTKTKKKTDKEVEDFTYNPEPSVSPNIYADQINYEQKSREVSQQIPTDTIDRIHQIFNADQHLMPLSTSKFLLDDKQALEKPGSGPLGASHRKKLSKANKNRKPLYKVSASTKLKNGQVNPPDINWRLLQHKPSWNLVPESHNLHIEGGKIHGGTINGGFISGGDIEGGDIEGGVITGGKILGGIFRDGRMENGVLKNGTVEGGVIQGGNIFGGKIRAGLVAGGRLRGGEVNGGKLSGGEIDGGVLKAGEIRGGLLKSGSVEGGLLKGGTIEGGHLLGGVMLGGKLKGGIVKSGVIKGGTIEGGVVDGGIIEDGVIIKGGVVRGNLPRNTTVVLNENGKNKTDDEDELTDKKIEEDLLNFSSSPSERVTLVKPTTAQMYKLKVDAASQDHYAEPAQQTSPAKASDEQISKPSDSEDPINISTLGAPESWPVESKHKAGKQTDSNKHKVASVSYSNTEEQKQKVAMDKPTTYQSGSNNKVKAFSKVSGNKDAIRYADKGDEFQQLAKDSENADQKSLMMRSPTPISWIKNMASSILKSYGTTTRATIGNFKRARELCSARTFPGNGTMKLSSSSVDYSHFHTFDFLLIMVLHHHSHPNSMF